MTSQPLISLCDRLKQRYENNQQDWKSLFQDQIQDKNSRDIEFIRYIVNSIIEQAKHNIVISELPEVIRTLHCEAETIIRKNRMITLEEAMAQIQIAGAKKYPYLKKIKPISTEDFVKEVIYEVFNRIGTVITLNMFVTCSAKQLLHAMPAIDVNEATSLIVEDILRHQDNNVSSPTSKEWMNSKRESLKLMQNSNQSYIFQLSKSKSNTQTYSIHSEEAVCTKIKRPTIASISNVNNNQITSTFCYSKDRPFLIEAMYKRDPKEASFHSEIRHYSKYCHQHSNISDNES
ncbi:unnamed protein product [Adineta steineri]|uniref:Uncharacterized protein n=1 Tax=Adineta steineri TaxID=433720 RepID=A0A818I524_9BILA|nr:unnamed protein product [Adineta steineri]CAF3514239.1 unnamed protein product [Adineta steineri]CAF3830803.1 unnamed protein product [Adineta steineri]